MPLYVRQSDGSLKQVNSYRRNTTGGLDLVQTLDMLKQPGEDPTPAPTSGLPARVVQGYFEGYGGLRLKDCHPNYNLIMWSFAIGIGDSDPGALQMWPGFYGGNTNNHNTLGGDIKVLQDAGKRVVLSIGGAQDLGPSGHGYRFTTAAHVDRFMATIVPLIDTYGFHGIDWDLENQQDGYFNAPSMIDASRRLKTRYGSGFIVGAAPYGGRNTGTSHPQDSGGEVTAITHKYRDLALALGSQLDLMSHQFYMNGDNTIAGVKQWSQEYIEACKLRDDQWAFGWSTRDPSDPYYGAVTPEFCNQVWDSWRSDGREARGAMLWAINRDQSPSPAWTWAATAGGKILSTS